MTRGNSFHRLRLDTEWMEGDVLVTRKSRKPPAWTLEAPTMKDVFTCLLVKMKGGKWSLLIATPVEPTVLTFHYRADALLRFRKLLADLLEAQRGEQLHAAAEERETL